MLGLFGKQRKYPTLTLADQMIIATLKQERKAASKAFDRYMRTKNADETIHAQATAEWRNAHEREDKAKAAYDAMMARLVADARAAIAKATGGRDE